MGGLEFRVWQFDPEINSGLIQLMNERKIKPVERVLVTGGGGFVGGYVLNHLCACGYAVTNFDLVENKHGGGSFIQGSILDSEAVQGAVNETDIIFHFAGFSNINLVKENPKSCIELNVMGTVNILEAIRKKGSGKFVFASSVYVHNKNGHLYTTSKRASELICQNYYDLFGLPVATLRLGTVYGEKSRHEDVISIFTRKAVCGEPITIHGSGEQVRHFIHGEDVANACSKLIENNNFSGTYILSSKRGVSIRELSEILAKNVSAVKIEKIERMGRADDYQGDLGDGSMLENTYKKLQWEPKINIDEGVRRLIQYFQKVPR